jgi:HlyD family type I secretion membrane fusion protein
MPKIENKEIEIRSDEVQEILSHTPNWMIRWGITSIFFLILILIGISYFVKYPDVIKGNILVTTEVPPVKLVSKTNGQLTRIYVINGEEVKENDIIADIESPLTDSTVIYLKQLVSSTQFAIDEFKSPKINFENELVFGEVQTEFGQLKKTYNEYYQVITDSYQKKKINRLRNQITNYDRLGVISNRQLKLTEQDLKNGKEKFQSEKNLYDKGVISKMEFFEKQTVLNQNKQQVENLKKTYVQNQITISDLKKQLVDMEYETSEKERTLKESIEISCNNIQNYLNTWQQNYRITASFDGTVSYLTTLNENQFVTSGTNLFAIVPNNNEYIGTVQIPSQGFGKVKVGQTVHIKLDNYPYNEFGQLEGVVKEISLIPSVVGEQKQSVYLAKVSLTKGLTTTYKKELEFKPEMSGTAEIVTEDLRLIERIFNQFRKIMDK